MTETLSEYLVDVSGDVPAIEYEIRWDDVRGEVVVQSETDDGFSGRILNMDKPDQNNYGDIFEHTVKMRAFRERNPELEHRLKTFGLDISREVIPTEYDYIVDDDVVGIRVKTEVDEHVYGFQTCDKNDYSENTLIEDLFKRQLSLLKENLLEDFVLENVTLGQDND